jgi:rhodanese-related sulfurtransferase
MLIGTLKAQYKDVKAEEFKKYVDSKKGVLIDLRTPAEISSKGKIKGAKEIDYFSKDAESEILKLDKKKTYLIYCAGGGRSGECLELMKKNSFKHVINLSTGFDEWKKKGYDIEKK